MTACACQALFLVNAPAEGLRGLFMADGAQGLRQLVCMGQGRYGGVAVDARHAAMRILLIGVVALQTFLALEGSSRPGAEEKHERHPYEKDLALPVP